MNKSLKIIGVLAVAFIFMGAGCARVSKDGVEEKVYSGNTPSEDYFWKEQNVKFKYQKGLSVIPNGEDSLYLHVDSQTIPDSAASGLYPRLDALPNIALERVIEIYKTNNSGWKSQSKERIGNYTFTKIQYEDGFFGEVRTHYLYASDDRVFDFRTGLLGHEGDTMLVLSSLRF